MVFRKKLWTVIVTLVFVMMQLLSLTQPVLALGEFTPPSPIMATPINMITQMIAPGVVQNDYIFNDKDGQRIQSHVLNIDMPNHTELKIEAGLPYDGKGKTWYGMQPMSQQAAAATRPGHQVIAATNGDYYNMSDGYPCGIVVKDGIILKGDLDANWYFFGMKKDGTYIMGNGNLFNQVKNDLQQALSGDSQIIKNGVRDENQIASKGDTNAYDPRIGIGVRKDGTMFFAEVDGRQTGFSRGITMSDFADYMLSLGAYNAIHLDGGGSATLVTRTPGTDKLEDVNRPSDGVERSVANGFLLVSTAAIDHQFASAYVYPNGMTITPNSSLQFSAKGQDASGASSNLPPTGLSWSLSDDSFGTVDPSTGLFSSNGKQGQFKVVLSYNGNMVGSAWLEVAVPNSLSFAQSEISLDYGVVKSLGLIARYEGRDVQLKPGDIIWGNIPEGMGTMDESNTFHAASTGSFDTNITATFAGTNTTASIHTLLGQLPVVLYDFENGIADWKAGTAGRGETSQLQWNTYPNDLTRFGNHSLQINFDFTKGITNATLGAYAGPAASKDVPGRPKAIGAWVYATPESQRYWLRCYIYDAKGQYQPINFTTQTVGINWTGWKYVEAPIPDSLVGPFKTFPNQMFRIMSLKSGMPGGNPMRKGFIVVDNVRVTYGANVDDMYPPIIHGINVDGKTFTSSRVEISASFNEDASDKYATGINYDRVRIYVDGSEYTHAEGIYALNIGLNTVAVSNMSFQDGVHRVDVDVQDNFGNETVKTAYFTVNTGLGTKVSLTSPDGTANLGGIYRLNINTSNSADITGITAQIKIGKEFPVAGVDFAPSAAGSTYIYNASTGIVSLNIANVSAEANPATLATIKINIPGSTLPGTKLSYDVLVSNINYVSAKPSLFAPTFSTRPAAVEVASAFNLVIKSALVGRPGIVAVTDGEGKPVEGATVTINAGGIFTDVGVTDASGIATCALMTDTVKKFDIFAQKDGMLSFTTTTQSFAPLKDKIPSNLMAGATTDPSTMKTITWMSNPLSSENAAIMQIASKTGYAANGEAAFENVNGASKELIYSGSQDISSNGIVRENSATAINLTSGTTYSFRVGDGVNWSDVREFTTLADNYNFSFNVFGDTQSPDLTGLADFDKILTSIESQAKKPDFSIHVGDFTDDAGQFMQMDAVSSLLSGHKAFDSIDMIHVLGNHEYMGDDGSKAAAIFGNSQSGLDVNPAGCYSMDYENMHIAVIGWTDAQTIMQNELDWLRKDMNASDKLWKVVITHQPVYNTNPDDSTMFKTMLSPVVDELGIDLVFSGHDHAYGRTKQLKGGIETAGGTTYIETGTTGPKHYSAVNDGNFVVMNDVNSAMYITADVSGGAMTITAKQADETIVDQFKLVKDIDAPVITITGAEDNGLYNKPVTPVVSAEDANLKSTVVTLDDQPYAGNVIDKDGRYTLTVVSIDKAGNKSESSISFTVDQTSPVITVNCVKNGDVVKLNQDVTVTWSCSDETSGIETSEGDLSSGAKLDTSKVGAHTLAFTAIDKAGNKTVATITYYVEYNYSGVLKPIKNDGSDIFKLGSTIPVKFLLKDAKGAFVTNAAAKLYIAEIIDGKVGQEFGATSTPASNSNSFRYDSADNQYIFNLNTGNMKAGAYQIRIDLGDGTTNIVKINLK